MVDRSTETTTPLKYSEIEFSREWLEEGGSCLEVAETVQVLEDDHLRPGLLVAQLVVQIFDGGQIRLLKKFRLPGRLHE